jgi:hypothetical protein
MSIDTQLLNVCLAHGEKITGLSVGDEKVHGGRLLLTLAGLESNFGEQRLFVRFEPAYAPDGMYYNKSLVLRKLWFIYGALSASSFGAFQIMYATARELGFTGNPVLLQNDDICAQWATELITKRFIKAQGVKTLEQVLDAYNSGNAHDTNVPKAYVAKGLQIYNSLQSV